MNEENLLHAVRARELCAIALAQTVVWDPYGVVCSHAADIYRAVDELVSTALAYSDNPEETYLRLLEAREPAIIPYRSGRNGARALHRAWDEVSYELYQTGIDGVDTIVTDIGALLEDHVSNNL